MTEDDWRVCADPTPRPAYLCRRASGRRLRLFACAGSRRVWDRLDAPGLWAIQAAERAAGGEGPDGELWAAHVEAHSAALRAVSGWGANRRHDYARFAAASRAAPDAAEAATMVSQDLLRLADEGVRRPAEESAQVAAIRCVFGDPFPPGRGRSGLAHLDGAGPGPAGGRGAGVRRAADSGRRPSGRGLRRRRGTDALPRHVARPRAWLLGGRSGAGEGMMCPPPVSAAPAARDWWRTSVGLLLPEFGQFLPEAVAE